MKAETEQWLRIADGHLGSAGVLLKEGHYPQCVFFCEQAIECLLKAIWIERSSEGVPPKIHHLVDLAEELALPLSEAQAGFLRRLQEQYMPTRYGDVAVEYSEEAARTYHVQAEEMFEWLRPKLN